MAARAYFVKTQHNGGVFDRNFEPRKVPLYFFFFSLGPRRRRLRSCRRAGGGVSPYYRQHLMAYRNGGHSDWRPHAGRALSVSAVRYSLSHTIPRYKSVVGPCVLVEVYRLTAGCRLCLCPRPRSGLMAATRAPVPSTGERELLAGTLSYKEQYKAYKYSRMLN